MSSGVATAGAILAYCCSGATSSGRHPATGAAQCPSSQLFPSTQDAAFLTQTSPRLEPFLPPGLVCGKIPVGSDMMTSLSGLSAAGFVSFPTLLLDA